MTERQSHSADSDSAGAAFARALDQFDTQPRASIYFLDQFTKDDYLGFQNAALEYLKSGNNESGKKYLLRIFDAQGILQQLLMNPKATTVDEAIDLASLAKPGIPLLELSLAKSLKDASDEDISRILSILARITENNRILAMIVRLLNHTNGHIREKASQIFGKYCQNSSFAEASLKDHDPRIRANAIEGLWNLRTSSATSTLLKALGDLNSRVAANAALGLRRRGHHEGMQMLLEMASYSEPFFRSSAAWAMGESGDDTCLPALENLKSDLDEIVVRNAVAAIDKIRKLKETQPKTDPSKPKDESSSDEQHASKDRCEQSRPSAREPAAEQTRNSPIISRFRR